ncbi:hypothetical protein BDV96DRAFT_693045 [Lophiotrema nucula]|uniref:Uncharacterized protein n=1 Tax=Lophiotrema nucula TaxID=690887 RepID=A0A6A5YN72_9PLEO|nr:hypothetical protein BDV96DRAFT_693045 [Lophiotrema nucula]
MMHFFKVFVMATAMGVATEALVISPLPRSQNGIAKRVPVEQDEGWKFSSNEKRAPDDEQDEGWSFSTNRNHKRAPDDEQDEGWSFSSNRNHRRGWSNDDTD